MTSATSKDGFVLLTNSERGMSLVAVLAHKVLPAEHKAFHSRRARDGPMGGALSHSIKKISKTVPLGLLSFV